MRWPDSIRIRCWVRRMRNFSAKVPDDLWPEVKAHLLAVRDAPTIAAGEGAAADLLMRYNKHLPSLCKALSDDLESLLGHLNLPWRQRKYVRTTNVIERSFVEERRRSKTLPRFFTEKSCIKLVYASLIGAGRTWQRIRITATELQQIHLVYQERKLAPTADLMEAAA